MTLKVSRLQTGLIALACLGLAAAGCSSSGSSGGSGNSGGGGNAKPSGTANVAYAASLTYLNEKVFGPAFAKATGYKDQGTAGTRVGVCSEIGAQTNFPHGFITVCRED